MKFDLNNKHTAGTIIALIVVAIVVVINFIVGLSGAGNFFRADLTQDKLYTLSDGSKNIIQRVDPDKPVTIRLYASTDDRVMPPMLRNYARNVEDLLNEFRKIGNGRITVEKLQANPNTDEADKAEADQVQGVPANNEGDKFYLGMAIECLDQKEVLEFLNPNDETKLEYNLSRSIQKVSKKGKPVVGIMSPLPMMGSGGGNPMMMMQQQQQQPPWAIVQQLKMDYDVREVKMNADKIDSDVNVLVVVHPANIEDQALYAIDQFVLRGGQLIAFVDPKSVVAEHFSMQQMQQNRMMGGQPSMINTQSNMKKLFDAWGIGFDDSMIVADMATRAQMGNRENPTALNLNAKLLDHTDRLTKDLNSLFMLTSGSFNVSGVKDGMKATVLAQSSEFSALISQADAEKANTQALNNFSAGGRNIPLIVKLTGKFKTAFESGAPAKADKPKEGGGAEQEAKPAAATPAAATPPATVTTAPVAAPAPAPAKPAAQPAPAPAPAAAAPAPAATPAPAPAIPPSLAAPAAPAAPATLPVPTPPSTPVKTDPNQLKESKDDKGSVLLIGDADMIYDGLCLQRDAFGGVHESNGNLSMFLSAIELLSGGGDLIAVRNRASTTRPFTTMQKKKSQVEDSYRPQMSKLEGDLKEATEKMANLKGKIDKKTQRIILDPTSQADMANWQEKQVQIQKKINEIKKEQRKAMDWEELKNHSN